MSDKDTPKYFFLTRLTDAQSRDIDQFYHSVSNVCIEQYPRWHHNVLNQSNQMRFFVAKENEQIVCSAYISEYKLNFLKFAHIQFGPVFLEPDKLIDSIEEIKKFYSTRGFIYLSIQLGIPSGPLTDYIECKLSRRFFIRYKFDRYNWTSLVVDLTRSEEEIINAFSKGHKSAVKKSIKHGLHVKRIESVDEIKRFTEIYIKMNIFRGIKIDPIKTTEEFKNVFWFLEREKKGFCLAVLDEANNICGGTIQLFQGESVRYFKGAADPEIKKIPVLHLAVWEAIKTSKELQYRYFDLWGYNHYVDEEDQIYYINQFKKGFTKQYIFYPKIMHIDLKPFGYSLYSTLRGVKKFLMK